MATRNSIILVVDDRPDEVRGLAELLRERVDAYIRHPQEVTIDDLSNADLVLVDYLLEVWPERDAASSLSLQPANGLALAGVLRSRLNHDHLQTSRHRGVTAFALHSAHLGALSGGLTLEITSHAAARSNNLEWAFEKQSLNSVIPLADQLVALAEAVRRLPKTWPDNAEQTKQLVTDLLGLSLEKPWFARAWTDIEDCHPPLHELSTATQGLALLRWLLHRILPYPCFLTDEWHLAARTGIEHRTLAGLIGKPHVDRVLEPVRYRGILAPFLGPRWWRSGIEALLWGITDGQSFDARQVRHALSNQWDTELSGWDEKRAIVCLDQRYAPLPDLCHTDDSVRIQPDDWPPFAEQAWTTIDLAVNEPLMRSLVVSEDRDRLDSSRPELADPEKV